MKNLMICLMCFAAFLVQGQQKGSASNPHVLEPSSKTVAWGHYWSETPPVLKIKSGDYVKVRTVIGSMPDIMLEGGLPSDQIEKELLDILTIKDHGPGPHFLTGPIYVEGAEPGDVLEVQIRRIELAIPYGNNFFYSQHGGFMAEDVPGKSSRIIPFDLKKMTGRLAEGIEIPLRPFFGSMGVAPPKEAGRWNSAPPWIHAGNMDNKELVAGTTLYIPVYIKGALFEIGDGHAAQGNGEVDGTAIETALKGELRFVVHKGKALSWPRAETPTHVMTMGCDKDLTQATQIAVREMIHYLMTEKNLSQADAYMLSSVAVDLSITQLVDGNVGVHAMLPKNVFVRK